MRDSKVVLLPAPGRALAAPRRRRQARRRRLHRRRRHEQQRVTCSSAEPDWGWGKSDRQTNLETAQRSAPSRCRRGGASTRRPPPQFRASWPRTSSRQRTSWALAGRRAGRAERLPAGSPPSWQPPRAAGGAGGAEAGGAGPPAADAAGAEVGGDGPPAADAAGGAGGEEDMSIDGGEGDELLGDVGEDDAAGAGQTQAKRNAAIIIVALLYHIFSFAPRLAPLAVGALVAPLAPLA